MSRPRALTLVSLAVTSLLAACGKDGGNTSGDVAVQKSSLPRDTAPVVSTDDAAQLAAGNQAFAIDLYHQLSAQPGNLIYSPASISLALAMLYNGAAGATAAQMAAALHFSLPLPGLNAAFDAMDLALTASSGGSAAFQLSVANSLWGQQGFQLQQPFLDALATGYGAGVNTVDFKAAPDAARADIDDWVSDQTQGRIPMLFAPGAIDAQTRLVLVDAVYFHGDWDMPFDANSTNGTFHASSGDVSVPMMSGPENIPLWSGTGWSAAALPYKGETTQMVLVVPDAGTFAAFEQSLTTDQLTAILGAPRDAGTLMMPKFQFKFGQKLNGALQALGMQDAFDDAADFSGVDGAMDLQVDTIVHQADIAVDEAGTTAAAATGVTLRSLSIALHALTVDRPFLFFIVHQPTGAILFAGRVVDPSAG